MFCVTEPTGNNQPTAATTGTETLWTTTLNQAQTSTVDSHSTTLTDELTTVTGLQTPTGRLSRRVSK